MEDLDANIILTFILVIAVLGKANSVAVAVTILLLIKLINLDQIIYPVIEKNGVQWGLVILIAAILIPIANGSIMLTNIKQIFTSWIGVISLILSLFTTYLSGLGLDYLTIQGRSDIIPAI